MKGLKRRCLHLALALSLALSLLPAMVFQAAAATTTTVVTSGTTTLNGGTIYVVNTNTAVTDLRVADNALVTLYIAPGATLTCSGSAGSLATPGKAGVYLPSSSTLVVTGGGTLVAKGGSVGAGTVGSAGGTGVSANGGTGSGTRYTIHFTYAGSSEYISGGSGGGAGGLGSAGTSGKINNGSSGTVTGSSRNGTFVPASVMSTATLDKQGGTGGADSVTLVYGCALNYAASSAIAVPTRAGYDFMGYYTAQSGGEQYCDASGRFSGSVVWLGTSNPTLYARWQPNAYRLSYQLSGGSVSPDNPAMYAYTAGALTLNNPTRSGFAFTGWTQGSDPALSTAVTIPAGNTADKSFTAHWKANTPTGTPGDFRLTARTDTTLTFQAPRNSAVSTPGTLAYRLRQEGTGAYSSWQDGTDGAITFTGLAADTGYTVECAVKAITQTGYEAAGSDTADIVLCRTKAVGTSPAAPTVTDKTAESITIDTAAGCQYLWSAGPTVPSDWSAAYQAAAVGTHTFVSLSAATAYYLFARTAETDSAMPSPAAVTTQYTRFAPPAAGQGYTIDYAAETVTAAAGYEISAVSDFQTVLASSGAAAAITPGQTCYVRRASAGPIPESLPVSFTAPARPAAPDAPSFKTKDAASVTLQNTSPAQEYSIDGGAAWVTGTGGDCIFIGLAQGQLCQIITRVKATADGFASADSPALTEVVRAFLTPGATVSAPDYTYGDTPSTPAITRPADNDSAVTYYVSTVNANIGGTPWSALTPIALDAGTYYVYAVSARDDDPAQANDYEVYTTGPAAFQVARRVVTPTVAGVVSKPYDGTNISVGATVTLTGAVSSQTPAVTDGYTVVWSDTAAHTASVNVTGLALSGTWSANYRLSATALTGADAGGAEILPASLTLPARLFSYDGGTSFSYGGFATGIGGETVTLRYTLSAPDAGTYAYAPSGGAGFTAETDSANYTVVSAENVTVLPLAVRLTWTDNGPGLYNGQTQSVAAAVANAVPGDLFALAYLHSSASGAGAFTAAVTGLGNANYTLAGGTGLTHDWSILRRTVTVTADDKTITLGQPLPAFTVSYDGFAPGETAAGALAVQAQADCAHPGTVPGAYAVTVTTVPTALADNYTFVTVPGTLRVNKAAAGIALEVTPVQMAGKDVKLTVTLSNASVPSPVTGAALPPWTA